MVQPAAADAARASLPPVSLVQVASPVARQSLHAVQIEAPTGGWSAQLDQERAAWQRREVYITLTRPSPLFVTTQAITPILVATNVPAGEAIDVFLRLADPHTRPRDSDPYTPTIPQPAPPEPAIP